MPQTTIALAALAFLVSAACALLFGVLGSSGAWTLFGVGLLAPAVLLGPLGLLRRRVSLLDPVMLFAGYVVVGTTMGAAFMAFGEGPRRDYMMEGESVWFFAVGGMWLIAGLLAFAFANGLTRGRIEVEKIGLLEDRAINPTRLALIGLVGVVLSTLATLAFLQQTGGINFANITGLSHKRTLIIAMGGGEQVRGAAGYLRALASITLPAALFVAAWAMSGQRRWTVASRIGVGVMILSAVALPFFASSRSDVVVTLIQLLMIVAMFGRIRMSAIIVVVVVGLTAFSAMTTLRTLAQGSDLTQRSASSNPLIGLGASGNGLSIAGTSLIVQRVPERMPYMMGESFFTWITAPVPRSVWPQKPDVSLGKTVKEEILGHRAIATGRPPGIFGEGYMNFGGAGLLLCAVLFGAGSRVFWESFAPTLGRSINSSVLFVLLAPHISVLANANFSQVMVRILTSVATFAIVVACLNVGTSRTRRVQNTRSRRAPIKQGDFAS